MKNFLKHFLTKNNLFLVVLFLVAAGIRFYNFPSRVTFWSEQARSLIVSADYLKTPSLLGQSYFVRQDSNSHLLYAGAIFNYSLIPLLFISGFDPIIITVFFTFLNLFTGLIIYLVVKRVFNKNAAILSAILFLFNDLMIYHSFFIWIYNLLPLIGILIAYFIWKYFKKRKSTSVLILGLLGGLGVSLQFLFLPLALAVILIVIWKSRIKIKDVIIYVFGMVLGNLPMVIFDLRHNFYESRTLFQYFIDTLMGKSNAGIAYYYFLPFWPILAASGGLVFFWVWKKSRILVFLILIVYLVLNLTSNRVNWNAPTGMPPGLTINKIDRASKVIAQATNGDFNVSEVLDFDSQAYVLRYFVEYKYNKKPLGVTDYIGLKSLYVLAKTEYNFDNSGVWEIYSGGPYNISLLTNVGQGYAVYKLTK